MHSLEHGKMPTSAVRDMCRAYNASVDAAADAVRCPDCGGTTLTIVEQDPMPEDDSHRFRCEKCRLEFNVS